MWVLWVTIQILKYKENLTVWNAVVAAAVTATHEKYQQFQILALFISWKNILRV